jgi:hypothetical protein
VVISTQANMHIYIQKKKNYYFIAVEVWFYLFVSKNFEKNKKKNLLFLFIIKQMIKQLVAMNSKN